MDALTDLWNGLVTVDIYLMVNIDVKKVRSKLTYCTGCSVNVPLGQKYIPLISLILMAYINT